MSQKYNLRPAEYVGICDESIAFYFDVECTEILVEYEMEQEGIRLEAMSLGAMTKQMLPTPQSSGALTGDVIGEITQANFRDQGF